MKQYETEMLIQRRVHYNDEDMYGIYACNTVEFSTEFKVTKYGNITIQGIVSDLVVGNKYKMTVEGPHVHPKHGVFYKILEIKFEEMNTVESQDSFLLSLISETHFNALKKAYPQEKLVDFIMADKVDVQLTKGIKETTLNKIKNKLNENLKLFSLMVKLKMLKISPNKLNAILQHFQTASKAIAIIDQNIYELCKISGFGFKTVDEIAMRRGDDPENKQRISACILHHLHEDTNDGHTWSYKSFILAECVKVLNLEVGIVETVMFNMDSKLIFQNEVEIALKSIRDMEIAIYQNLKRINDSYVSPSSTGHVEYRLNQTEKRQGFEFTDEQRTAIIEGYSHGVVVLNGLAGAGKTATVKGLIDSLGTENYMTAALSGKAVNVLSQRGIRASTIHRMLRYVVGSGFYHNEFRPLPYKVIVLDELSMINVELILTVLKAIPSGSKLVLVGDSGQLPAIGYGDVLRDLLNTNMFAKFELTKVHRQAAKSGILSLANRIRKGEQILPYGWSGHKTFGENEDQSIIGRIDKKEVYELVLETAKHYKAKHTTIRDLLDFQVIVANRDRGDLSVRNLNNALQGIFNDLEKPFLNRNGYNFREGDKVITQGNIYKKSKFSSVKEYYEIMRTKDSIGIDEEILLRKYEFDLYNGTLGYIETLSLETEKKLVFIRLEGQEGVVVLEGEEMNKIDMAYAATVHRLQGSSIKNVILALDHAAYILLSKQLVYTALTRASERGVALVETNAFYTAVKNDASGARRTYLADIIFSQMQHK